MDHRKFGKKLGRNRREREALFKSLVRAIFTHGTIKTTAAKAKSIISLVEKLSNHIITKDIVNAQRELSTYIQDKSVVHQIYTEFKSVFTGQTSNFTKMWNLTIRQGDNALLVKLAFVKPYSLKNITKAEPQKEVVKPKKEIKPKKVTKKAAK